VKNVQNNETSANPRCNKSVGFFTNKFSWTRFRLGLQTHPGRGDPGRHAKSGQNRQIRGCELVRIGESRQCPSFCISDAIVDWMPSFLTNYPIRGPANFSALKPFSRIDRSWFLTNLASPSSAHLAPSASRFLLRLAHPMKNKSCHSGFIAWICSQ
jgi:hypothetical protein